MSELEGTLRGLPRIPDPTPLPGEDPHAAFHRRSLLPTPSSLCTTCHPAGDRAVTREAVEPLVAAEWANFAAMVSEATAKGRPDEMPPAPTWASVADSWAQMPDDVRAELLPDLDAGRVTAWLQDLTDRSPEATP